MSDHSPPHDAAAERVVLGAMMDDPSVIAPVMDRVDSRSFYDPRHVTVFNHVLAAWHGGDPVDPIAITHRLDAAGDLRTVDASYLHDLVRDGGPLAGQVGYYAGIVADRHRDRRYGELSIEVAELRKLSRERQVERVTGIIDNLADLVGIQAATLAPSLGPVPDYPSPVLPGPLGELVAGSGGLPDALVAGAGLAAAASVMPTAELRISDTMTEVAALWVPLVAPRGAGKTPSMDIALGPVRAADADQHRVYRDELDAWLATPRKDRDPKPPRDWTYLVGDLTLEKLARRLDASDGAATIASDELVLILGALGEYKRGGGGDRGRILGLWSAQPWRYQRVGDGVDLLVDRPVVTIVGGIQPPLHHRLGGEEDGMRPRWLPHVATLDVAAQDAGGMATVAPSWAQTLGKLHGNRTARTWTLDGSVYRAWLAARRRWKSAAGGGETASTSAALVKADVQVARVALVLAETIDPGKGGLVPPEAMTAAVAIVDFVMDCWRSLPEEAGPGLSRRAEVQDSRVERLRAWLEDRSDRQAAKQELLRAQVAGVRVAAELDELLTRYVATYPGTVATRRSGAKGGRPATVVSAPSRGYGA